MSYLFIALSYLIGSLNFAYIVAKYKKLDISSSGSGNPGTSNVMRTIGKKYAAIVLIGDVLKGFLPIYLFDENLLLCGFAAVIGHIFPIFYKFKGGKGVATSFGVILAFDIILGFICLLTWLITAFLFRYSALSAIVSFALLPIYTWFSYEKIITTSLFLILAIIVIYMHKTNIKNLLNNKETKIGSKN